MERVRNTEIAAAVATEAGRGVSATDVTTGCR